MPEILTMIQVKRMTPAPAVLFMSFLSLIYLGSSNISRLISYVGFATWVSFPKGRREKELKEESLDEQGGVSYPLGVEVERG